MKRAMKNHLTQGNDQIWRVPYAHKKQIINI